MILRILPFAQRVALVAALGIWAGAALAQAQVSASNGVTVTSLLNEGFNIVAASTDGTSQFLYLQGTDTHQKKVAYACQIQFGLNGGFRGCLILP